MSMWIYLASSFKLATRVEHLATALELSGHKITRKWWKRDFKTTLGEMSDEEWYAREEVRDVCKANFDAIDRADVVILVCPIQEPTKFNGANIEVGYAIAKGKLVLSFGALERSGMYSPVKRCATRPELFAAFPRASVEDGPKSAWERYSRVLGEKANEVETEAYPDGEGTWRCCRCGDVVRIEGHGSKIRYYCRLCQEVADGGGQE